MTLDTQTIDCSIVIENDKKMCLILLLSGNFFEKPNLHLFTKYLMLSIKQNHVFSLILLGGFLSHTKKLKNFRNY
jgi:hypothetical protein